MPIPGEDFVLRLRQTVSPSLRVNVVDVTTGGIADPVALVAWELGSESAPGDAGLALVRFDPLGNIRWQLSRVFCTDMGFDCGRWRLESGAVIAVPEGFMVAATLVHADSGLPRMLVMRVTDAGVLQLARLHAAELGAGPVQGRAIGIVPLDRDEHYLMAARSSVAIESWFFEITGEGIPTGVSFRIPDTVVRRLRRTLTHGIFAAGEKYVAEATPRAWLLNLDTGGAAPKWERVYDNAEQGQELGLRWFDIAEGEHSLVAIGNLLRYSDAEYPIIANLFHERFPPALPGEPRYVIKPVTDGRIVLNSIVNHITEPPPEGGERLSDFSIAGELSDVTWHFTMEEDLRWSWQKSYDRLYGGGGSLTSVTWPTVDNILVGGRMRKPVQPVSGLLVSSRATIDRGKLHCSSQTGVRLPHVSLTSVLQPSPMPPLTILASDWVEEEAPPLQAERGCFDVPQ